MPDPRPSVPRREETRREIGGGRPKGVLIMQGPSYLTDVLGLKNTGIARRILYRKWMKLFSALPLCFPFFLPLTELGEDSLTSIRTSTPRLRQEKRGIQIGKLPVLEFCNFFCRACLRPTSLTSDMIVCLSTNPIKKMESRCSSAANPFPVSDMEVHLDIMFS